MYNNIIMQVDSAWSSGNYEQARSHSSVAKVLNIIGIIIGSISWISVGIIVIYGIATSAAAANAAVNTGFRLNRNRFG